jgi:hypothetical protein
MSNTVMPTSPSPLADAPYAAAIQPWSATACDAAQPNRPRAVRPRHVTEATAGRVPAR